MRMNLKWVQRMGVVKQEGVSASANSMEGSIGVWQGKDCSLCKQESEVLPLNQIKHLVFQKHIFSMECVRLQYALRSFGELKSMWKVLNGDFSTQTKEMCHSWAVQQRENSF